MTFFYTRHFILTEMILLCTTNLTMRFKKVTLLLLVCITGFTTYAQFESSKQVYKSPNLTVEISRHKTVAILPFQSTITFKKQPKNFDAAANKADEQKLATGMQEGLYTYLLRKSKDFTVSFQDVERTNALLKQKGIFESLNELTQDSVCKILGVDAVIKCKYLYQRTASDGGAIAKGILLGSAFSNTGAGELIMQIYNAKDGELLWRFYKEMNENVMGSTNQVMERMMRKVARNFPYEN